MISYESSKWYVKLWRQRWYIYATFLHVRDFINIDIGLEYLMFSELDKKTKSKIRKNWRDIKKHVELSKMYKFSAK